MSESEQFTSKYRPKSFKTFLGNDGLAQVVEKQLSGNIPHTWLITGDSNSGKTSLGRIIARKLLTVAITDDITQVRDYYEENIGIDKSIEKMRQIAEHINYKPRQGDYKIILLDEAHKLLENSASALLKSLEEPPKHVIFILCTDQPDKLLKTVRNRCYQVHLSTLDKDATLKLINRVVKKENIKFIDDELAEKFAENFAGQPRILLTTLQTLQNSHKDTTVSKEEFSKFVLESLTDESKQAQDTLFCIYNGDLKKACQLSQQYKDPRYYVSLLQEFNHNLICRATGADFLSYPQHRAFWKLIIPIKDKLKLSNMLIVQEQLLELKKDLTYVNVNNPKYAVLFYLSKALISIKG